MYTWSRSTADQKQQLKANELRPASVMPAYKAVHKKKRHLYGKMCVSLRTENLRLLQKT